MNKKENVEASKWRDLFKIIQSAIRRVIQFTFLSSGGKILGITRIF